MLDLVVFNGLFIASEVVPGTRIEIAERVQPHDLHSPLGLANDEDTGNKNCIKIADNGHARESKNIFPAR